jgi:hypothetical protein
MWPSRTPFRSLAVRHHLLLCFLLSVSLPLAAQSTPPPQQAPFLTTLVSLLNPLSYTLNEIYGVLLSLGLLALCWWVRKSLCEINEKLRKIEEKDRLNPEIPKPTISLEDFQDINKKFQKLYDEFGLFKDTIKPLQSDFPETKRQANESWELVSILFDKVFPNLQQETNQRHKKNQYGHTRQSRISYTLDKQKDERIESEIESQPIDHDPVIDSSDLTLTIVANYQDAFSRDDRSALRQMVSDEMSITQDCEQALLRGTASATTQLQIDKQGGSYLLIRQNNKNWLVPTFLTLKSFTTIQPAKGLFVYERDNVSSAELRRPAEVREDRGVWEVVNMGVVAVPA